MCTLNNEKLANFIATSGNKSIEIRESLFCRVDKLANKSYVRLFNSGRCDDIFYGRITNNGVIELPLAEDNTTTVETAFCSRVLDELVHFINTGKSS